MIVNDWSELNREHQNTLLELGNIGTGSALTALSRLTDHPIKMELPRIRITGIDQLPNLIGQQEPEAGVLIEATGGLDCVVTFLLNESFTKVISEELTGEPLASLSELNEMQESALCEIGNIMCNAYLNALAAMLEMEMEVSLPELKVGTCEEVLVTFKRAFDQSKPEMLFIENAFYYQDQEIVSYILVHPTLESLIKMLDKLLY